MVIVNPTWTETAKAKRIKELRSALKFFQGMFLFLAVMLLLTGFKIQYGGDGMGPLELIFMAGFLAFAWWSFNDSTRERIKYISSPELQRSQGFKDATNYGKLFPKTVASGWMWRTTMKNCSPGYIEGWMSGVDELPYHRVERVKRV